MKSTKGNNLAFTINCLLTPAVASLECHGVTAKVEAPTTLHYNYHNPYEWYPQNPTGEEQNPHKQMQTKPVQWHALWLNLNGVGVGESRSLPHDIINRETTPSVQINAPGSKHTQQHDMSQNSPPPPWSNFTTNYHIWHTSWTLSLKKTIQTNMGWGKSLIFTLFVCLFVSLLNV